MGEIVKSLLTDQHLYRFSADILMLVRQNAHIVSKIPDDSGLIFHLNLSSIFLGGSFLEANLNEDIAQCAHAPSPDIKPTPQFWLTLEEMQKDLSAVEKWNLIAATRGGQQWNAAAEPYQSYDTLVALRNELVHFKGRYIVDNSPPIKRLKPLIDRFKSKKHWKLDAMNVDPWLVSLVSSKDLALWIDSAIFNINARKDELLLGYTPKSELEKDTRQMIDLSRVTGHFKTSHERSN